MLSKISKLSTLFLEKKKKIVISLKQIVWETNNGIKILVGPVVFVLPTSETSEKVNWSVWKIFLFNYV